MKGDYKKIFLQSYSDFTLTHNSTSEMPVLVKKAEPLKTLALISPHVELNFEIGIWKDDYLSSVWTV